MGGLAILKRAKGRHPTGIVCRAKAGIATAAKPSNTVPRGHLKKPRHPSERGLRWGCGRTDKLGGRGCMLTLRQGLVLAGGGHAGHGGEKAKHPTAGGGLCPSSHLQSRQGS